SVLVELQAVRRDTCVLLIMIRLCSSPRFTVFPYTTLFRSHRAVEAEHRKLGWTGDPEAFGRSAAILIGDMSLVWAEDMLLDSGLDRKSTRLNSSHVSISYAVFCLKQKSS